MHQQVQKTMIEKIVRLCVCVCERDRDKEKIRKLKKAKGRYKCGMGNQEFDPI